MKKSRIILPAVALLTISTVAAASSTVAWFSASRKVTIATNEIGVYNPESALDIVLGGVAEAGSKVNAKDDKKIDLPAYLRDGSVDLNSGKVYKADLSKANSYQEVTNFSSETAFVGSATTATKIYRATSWTMTFSMKSATPDSYAIFLDISNLANSFAHSKVDKDSENAEANVYKSLRVGFKYDTGFVVVAPFYDDSEGNSLKYVKCVDSEKGETTVDTYDKAIIANNVKIDTSEIESETLTSNYKDEHAYVGTIAGTTDTTKGAELTVTAYLWFEGEDAFCASSEGGVLNTMINANLTFYAVKVL